MKSLKVSSNLVEIFGMNDELRMALHCSSNQSILEKIPDNFVHAIIQDEPYGLNPKEDDVIQLARSILAGTDYLKGGAGFNNEAWDSDVPALSHRRELFRILKPGGYVICMTGNRTLHLAQMGLVSAGFKIIDLMAWLHTQGNPKGSNFDQQLYRQSLKQFSGHRSGLRPTMEIAILAQKPISEKSAIQNLRKHGTGLLNIRDTYFLDRKGEVKYPTNIVLSDEYHKLISEKAKLFCIQSIKEELPLNLFPYQKPSIGEKNLWSSGLEKRAVSNFFTSAVIEPKANFHPTVKPIALMRHIVRLLTRKDDLVIDCFMGSGTTGRACLIEGRRFIGIEMSKEFFGIAKGTCINLYREMEEMEYVAEKSKAYREYLAKSKNRTEGSNLVKKELFRKQQELKSWQDYIRSLKVG